MAYQALLIISGLADTGHAIIWMWASHVNARCHVLFNPASFWLEAQSKGDTSIEFSRGHYQRVSTQKMPLCALRNKSHERIMSGRG